MSDDILYEVAGDIGTITFNRPEVYNAFNRELHAALNAALTEAADPAVRCVVITGAGKGFCAGQDLKEFGAVSGTVGDALEQTYHPNVLLVRKLPQTTRYAKQQLNVWRDMAWHQTIGHARDWLSLSMLGDEAQSAITAFLDSRRGKDEAEGR